MPDSLLEIRNRIKRKRNNFASNVNVPKKISSYYIYTHRWFNKILFVIVLMLGSLIMIKANKEFAGAFYKQVYEVNFSFTEVNKLYQKYLGGIIPFKDIFKEGTTPVFNEKLTYTETSIYLNGVKLTVDSNYLIPVNESGMVVFIGEKEGFGNTVIIQQMDGVDLWYGNVTNLNIKLYDYVEKGSLLGEADGDYLYLVYKKDGKDADYKEYLPTA